MSGSVPPLEGTMSAVPGSIEAKPAPIPVVGESIAEAGRSLAGGREGGMPAGQVPVIPPPDLRPALHQAKEAERSQIIGAYHQVLLDCVSQFNEMQKSKSFTQDEIGTICQGAVARAIMRKAKSNGVHLPYDQAQELAGTLWETTSRSDVQVIQVEGKVLLTQKEAQEMYSHVKSNARTAQKRLTKDYGHLCQILLELDKEIQAATSQTMAVANERILLLLRKAQQSDAYAFLCEDESIPAIAYLHRMTMALFIQPQPLDIYKPVGAQLVQSSLPKNELTVNAGTFVRVLTKMRDEAKKARLMVSDKTVEYVRTHWRKVWGALKGFVPGAAYDPRRDENAGGRLYAETLQNGTAGTTVLQAIYTPTPTIGDTVAPEALAFLQALENRHVMDPEKLRREPSYAQQTHWTFASLQSLDSRFEGRRARAIMDLNRQYPLSFTGITIAQDSPFYLDGAHGSSEEKIEESMVEHGKTPLDESYKNLMKQQLVAGVGYEFPPGFSPEKYQKAFGAIIEEAYTAVTQSTTSPVPTREDGESDDVFERRKRLWQWRQKAAFRELVNLGVMRYWQLHTMPAQGQGLVSLCCKECIDRGGKAMAELLWALGDGRPDTLKQVLYAVQGRPLIARSRTILSARLAPFVALAEFVSQDAARTFMTDTVGKLVDPPLSYSRPATPVITISEE